VRYGINVPNIGGLDLLVDLATAAESSGWDGFFLWDQMLLTTELPVPVFDPWVTLAAIAARTERIRLGTMITPISRRRPWKLARETVTLDHLSGGRLTLGVGLGVPAEADFEPFGEATDPRVRAARLDEGLEVLAGLWSGEPVDVEGEHFRVRARFSPVPVQRPRIPVWVAGVWPNRGPFRRAARWDGVYPLGSDDDGEMRPLHADEYPAVLAFIGERREMGGGTFDVVAAGVADGDPGVVDAYAEVGATWWMESDEGDAGWEGRMAARVRAGPPRGA
jgi:alkanesulfonate monooxygenase SsuD/methylene tetrahydromethanopterin reductase-like flavin-dependent oxidoreductase (luciferase family)